MTAILECKHLTHYYGKRKIYEDLNFEVPRGRILGLLGKNGTGKTTTINILSGYLKPRAGECRIFGERHTTMSPAMRRNIGLLLEGHVQYQFMTITQIEKFYSAFYPGQWRREAYYELMDKLKVAPGQIISRMSNGQRSQVALGLILAQNLNSSSSTISRWVSIRVTGDSSPTTCATMPVPRARLSSSPPTSYRTWSGSLTTASSWTTGAYSPNSPSAACSTRSAATLATCRTTMSRSCPPMSSITLPSCGE